MCITTRLLLAKLLIRTGLFSLEQDDRENSASNLILSLSKIIYDCTQQNCRTIILKVAH